MGEVHNARKTIDFRLIITEMKKAKRLYMKVIPVVFVIACLFIICFPREYISSTAMAPETESGMTGGGALGSIAASFGFDLSNMNSSDAITPLLYPDLMADNGFVASLFDIKVKSLDGTIDTDFYDYMNTCQKEPWWSTCIYKVKKLFQKRDTAPAEFNPYHLSRHNDDIMSNIRKSISINLDKKTGVISIVTCTQDALISKTLADSMRVRLQNYITDYRTNKARTDYEHYKELAARAKSEYEAARRKFSSYADSNTDVSLASYRTVQDDLENDLQLKYNAYSAMVTQMNAAETKILERTPAFTMIRGASVAIKADKPKRMIFVIVMCMMAFVCVTVWTLRQYMFADE